MYMQATSTKGKFIFAEFIVQKFTLYSFKSLILGEKLAGGTWYAVLAS